MGAWTRASADVRTLVFDVFFSHFDANATLDHGPVARGALLNAAAHGHARHVDISLTQTSGELRLTVDDDGQGLPAKTTQGTGTAIITSWVGVTGGTWSLAPAEQQGTRLVVTIPRG